MAKKEKISEERRKLIQEFIKSNELKTAWDIQEAIKDLFKDTIQGMLNAELTEYHFISFFICPPAYYIKKRRNFILKLLLFLKLLTLICKISFI